MFYFRFMATGGWRILNDWLVDAKKGDDFFVILEVLEVCVCRTVDN